MGRSVTAAELNTFVTGFITEASPLTFPANATLDEANFVLQKDGSRRRRLGIDGVENFSIINTSDSVPVDGEIVFNSFKWSNAGGNPEKTLVVVQIGNIVRIFDADVKPLSNGLIFTYTFFTDKSTKFGFAVVDGLLVIAAGLPAIVVMEYNDGAVS